MKPPAGVHWLRDNKMERSPHRIIVLDTETRPREHDDPDVQVLRLWAAKVVRRHDLEPRKPRVEWHAGTTAVELADMVERVARSGPATWLITHNLNFDLAVTALPVVLVERGWRLTEGALTTDSPWARMARGSRRLTIADSWSYLPQSVEELGRRVAIPKLDLPEWDDGDGAWSARCERDVEITATALLQLMDWWDAGGYGNWSLTGPATGWNSLRHVLPHRYFLIDPDPAARATEADAIVGGRRDVWQLGRRASGLYAELDISTAHLTAMSDCLLPYARLRHFDRLPFDHYAVTGPKFGAIAACEVEVSRPRYPWRTPQGVFHPVGRFRTTLAGPELADAARRGELRSVGPGWTYILGDQLGPWARWLASLLAVESHDVPPAVRVAAKAWSRSVPGKWAGHTSEVVGKRPDPRPGWSVIRGWRMPEKAPRDWLRIGNEEWEIARDLWSDDAFPAVLAFIQSYVRIALNRLLDRLGPAVLSCNTDGALIDVRRWWSEAWPDTTPHPPSDRRILQALDTWLATLLPELSPFAVRIKHAYRQVEIISPQHAILDREYRLSGIPRRAQRLGGGRYSFTQWPRLHVQIERDGPPVYRTRRAQVDLSNVPPPGWLMADGTVWPVAVWPGDDGNPHVLVDYLAADHGRPYAPIWRQHPLLRQLLPAESA